MLPGPTELVLILVVIVIIFGAGKLGGVGKAVGKSVREFKEEVQVDDKKKAQEFIIKYARASLKHKISNKLKILMYEFLVKIKDNPEIEQIFIDYIVQNEDINDPILKIIDSYWEK